MVRPSHLCSLHSEKIADDDIITFSINSQLLRTWIISPIFELKFKYSYWDWGGMSHNEIALLWWNFTMHECVIHLLQRNHDEITSSWMIQFATELSPSYHSLVRHFLAELRCPLGLIYILWYNISGVTYRDLNIKFDSIKTSKCHLTTQVRWSYRTYISIQLNTPPQKQNGKSWPCHVPVSRTKAVFWSRTFLNIYGEPKKEQKKMMRNDISSITNILLVFCQCHHHYLEEIVFLFFVGFLRFPDWRNSIILILTKQFNCIRVWFSVIKTMMNQFSIYCDRKCSLALAMILDS